VARAGKQSGAPHRRSRKQPAPAPIGRRATVGVAVSALFLIGLSARTIVRWDAQRGADRRPGPSGLGVTPDFQYPLLAAGTQHQSSGPYPEPHSRREYTDAELSTAVNRLFVAVERAVAEDSDLPAFAKEKIAWLIMQQRSGALSITLLKNAAGTNLSDEDLMASGKVEGRSVIVIAQPRFSIFLSEAGQNVAPFSRQQVNDFMLGLVHETVHLQNANPGNPASLADRLSEEVRAWREVDVNAVRPLRRLNQPMNARFTAADDALRSCEDQAPCQPLMEILIPTEQSR
jgi:hypothetical protein